ncbi:hypothetical protein LCC45_10100, partial [Staphylococcus aureus]|nr:hypothetical protein [Staphylococcus aureus]
MVIVFCILRDQNLNSPKNPSYIIRFCCYLYQAKMLAIFFTLQQNQIKDKITSWLDKDNNKNE